MENEIDHPVHYTTGGFECWDFLEAQGLPFLEGNVVKYITRYKIKGNPLADLKKALAYTRRIVERYGFYEGGEELVFVPVHKPHIPVEAYAREKKLTRDESGVIQLLISALREEYAGAARALALRAERLLAAMILELAQHEEEAEQEAMEQEFVNCIENRLEEMEEAVKQIRAFMAKAT
jgi:hypothetical protein